MSIDVDFTQGEVNSFTASGTPTYGSDGATFTVRQSGDAPQLTSVFYMMFGRVEFSMKAAPGAGIVSSFVLQTDDMLVVTPNTPFPPFCGSLAVQETESGHPPPGVQCGA